MPELTTPRGFEDRTPSRLPSVYSGRLWIAPSAGRPGLVRAQLARVVRQAPEVMVKASQGIFTGRKLKAHIDYISRHGALTLTGADGEQVQIEGLKDLVDRWVFEAKVANPRASIALPLILSMPAGTPEEALHGAAGEFAKSAFKGGIYVLAMHNDRAHPHVHLTVHSVGPHLQRIVPYKRTVERWREMFAEQLRGRGIDAEASPRWARGVVRRQDRQAIHHMRGRLISEGGPTPRVLEAALTASIEISLGEREIPPEHEAALSFHDTVHQHFSAEAKRLERSRDPAERELGLAATKFLKDLPEPLTLHQTYVARLHAEGRSHIYGPERSPDSSRSQAFATQRGLERDRSR